MKLQSAEMLLALADRDWHGAIRIMSDYFGKPFHSVPLVIRHAPDAPLEVNILYDGDRYIWEEYDGFWQRSSILGNAVSIYVRDWAGA